MTTMDDVKVPAWLPKATADDLMAAGSQLLNAATDEDGNTTDEMAAACVTGFFIAAGVLVRGLEGHPKDTAQAGHALLARIATDTLVDGLVRDFGGL